PTQAAVDDEGVKVMVAVDLPATAAVKQAPEPALSPIELQKWQGALEHWDAFLVFVIKNLGSIARRGDVRDDLLDLLLTSRHQLLTVLASGPTPGVDPVRQLFLDAWEQLRAIVRRGALQGGAASRAVGAERLGARSLPRCRRAPAVGRCRTRRRGERHRSSLPSSLRASRADRGLARELLAAVRGEGPPRDVSSLRQRRCRA